MILILSDETDISTNEVIDWLIYFKKDYLRINNTSKLIFSKFSLNNSSRYFELIIDGDKVLDSKSIQAFWYRRGHFNLASTQLKSKVLNKFNGINNYLNVEMNRLVNAIYVCIHSNPRLGKIFENETNKFLNIRNYS